MELYTRTSYELCERLTLAYSTSFGRSSKLLPTDTRRNIYAIYGLVRIADEIVDTYNGQNKAELLDLLEDDVYGAIKIGYSANPIVHAYANTVRRYEIDTTLITAFFDSMRMDLTKQTYDQSSYEQYIYGSAEVVGLMCLEVFCGGDKTQVAALSTGARSLGSAYQKVNFLRDFASDFHDRGRVYFPGVQFDSFDDTIKQRVIDDINHDFAIAAPAIDQLPIAARRAVALSYVYYRELTNKLAHTPADTIKTTRVRVSGPKKLLLLLQHSIKQGLS